MEWCNRHLQVVSWQIPCLSVSLYLYGFSVVSMILGESKSLRCFSRHACIQASRLLPLRYRVLLFPRSLAAWCSSLDLEEPRPIYNNRDVCTFSILKELSPCLFLCSSREKLFLKFTCFFRGPRADFPCASPRVTCVLRSREKEAFLLFYFSLVLHLLMLPSDLFIRSCACASQSRSFQASLLDLHHPVPFLDFLNSNGGMLRGSSVYRHLKEEPRKEP